MAESTGHNTESEEQDSGLQQFLSAVGNTEKLPGILSNGKECKAILENVLPDIKEFITAKYPEARQKELGRLVETGNPEALNGLLFEMSKARALEVRSQKGNPKKDRQVQSYDVASRIITAHVSNERQKIDKKPQVPQGITKSLAASNLNPTFKK